MFVGNAKKRWKPCSTFSSWEEYECAQKAGRRSFLFLKGYQLPLFLTYFENILDVPVWWFDVVVADLVEDLLEVGYGLPGLLGQILKYINQD